MTLLHLAERRAGRVMPRRWALDKEGQISMVEVGGCSEGFGKLESLLASTRRDLTVGPSLWQTFDAPAALEVVEAAIRRDSQIMVCAVEGSTRLLAELGAVRFAHALGEHRRQLREAFLRHGGVEVD